MHSTKSMNVLKTSFRIARQTAFMGVNTAKTANKVVTMNVQPMMNQTAPVSMINMPMRQFSANLPDFLSLEMPNLSPTMEKVSSYF